ncbi:15536_t:CDS:2 [Entrophospora sp. SA101]|nr:15536_t:CDS:2 [Entrophospora sp. SA101]
MKESKELKSKYPSLIKEVRGHGLMIGVQFNKDPAPLLRLARERVEEAKRGIDIFKDALKVFEKDQ